ncbi:MAG: Gfo/Idh/MocA family oxidoreductase [Planctomycetaceae bacterium]|jgi:predicted dehydrogenase|nr:Gfo/Idh/MocA family oxidoreductase [Planctomycetaceae bacterium]
MKEQTQPSRRDFLKTSGVVAAGLGAASGLGIARSAHAQGSDTIKVAVIGCGGRGRGAAQDRLDAGDNVKIVAVADVFERQAKGAAGFLNGLNDEGKYKGKIAIKDDAVFSGFDAYKHAIDADIDQVIIATPPGFRPVHYAYAVEKGKHVFMEKPLATDSAGYRSLLESNKIADEKNLKVVVGLQRRHGVDYKAWVERIHKGDIGDLVYTRVYWNGGDIWYRRRGQEQSEMEFQVDNWYHFVWLCGDNICEQHIHNLDVGNWIHSKGDVFAHPIRANGMGGLQVRDKNPDKSGEIYDHHAVEFEYADGSRMISQCRQIPGTWSSVSEHVHGTKGFGSSCWLNIEGQRWNAPGSPNHFKIEHVNHYKAIRDNIRTNDAHYGAISTMISILGRLATYSGNIVEWDKAVADGFSQFPYGKALAWDSEPPVLPKDGKYAVAFPGVFKAY